MKLKQLLHAEQEERTTVPLELRNRHKVIIKYQMMIHPQTKRMEGLAHGESDCSLNLTKDNYQQATMRLKYNIKRLRPLIPYGKILSELKARD